MSAQTEDLATEGVALGPPVRRAKLLSTAPTRPIATPRSARALLSFIPSPAALRLIAKIADVVAAFSASFGVMGLLIPQAWSAPLSAAAPFAAAAVAGLAGLSVAEAYRLTPARPVARHVVQTALGVGCLLCLLIVAAALALGADAVHKVMLAGVAVWATLTGLHLIYALATQVLQRLGALSETVIIVGATPRAEALIARNAGTNDLNILGVFDDRLARAPRSLSGAPVLGDLDDLLVWDRLPEVDRIIITVSSDAKARTKALIDRVRVLPQRVVLLLDLDTFEPETRSLAEIARAPAAYVSGAPKDMRRATLKRASDIVFALALLAAFAPIMAVCAALVRLEGSGPILFRQKRHGFNNQIIRVWKFRTMRHDPAAEERMRVQARPDDPRITRIGRFLRQTSLDELPQLFNVLKGDMSIVGPRPHALGMAAENTEVHHIVADYAHRHRVKPGITGWAQVNGSRGPAVTRAAIEERVRLDLDYIHRASFWLDLRIMAMTAPRLCGDAIRAR